MPDDNQIEGIILGVHGFCGDKESSALIALAEEMTKSHWGVFCFDFPAHGKSQAQDDALRIENCKQDLILAANDCREKYPAIPKALFATSFGGYVSLLCEKELPEFKFILRAPAVTMPEHILLDLLNVSPEYFCSIGHIQTGFERKIHLSYQFYQDLTENIVSIKIFDRPMLIIHGDADDVVPHMDIKRFCKINPKIDLCVVKEADHRFKKEGEIEQVILAAKKYILS